MVIKSNGTMYIGPRNKLFISFVFGDLGVLKMSNYGNSKIVGVGHVMCGLF